MRVWLIGSLVLPSGYCTAAVPRASRCAGACLATLVVWLPRLSCQAAGPIGLRVVLTLEAHDLEWLRRPNRFSSGGHRRRGGHCLVEVDCVARGRQHFPHSPSEQDGRGHRLGETAYSVGPHRVGGGGLNP